MFLSRLIDRLSGEIDPALPNRLNSEELSNPVWAPVPENLDEEPALAPAPERSETAAPDVPRSGRREEEPMPSEPPLPLRPRSETPENEAETRSTIEMQDFIDMGRAKPRPTRKTRTSAAVTPSTSRRPEHVDGDNPRASKRPDEEPTPMPPPPNPPTPESPDPEPPLTRSQPVQRASAPQSRVAARRPRLRDRVPEPIEVTVKIGRIEIGAPKPAPRPAFVPTRRPEPVQSLEDYLADRKKGRR